MLGVVFRRSRIVLMDSYHSFIFSFMNDFEKIHATCMCRVLCTEISGTSACTILQYTTQGGESEPQRCKNILFAQAQYTEQAQ
jgi:hypothetical protein